MTYAHMIAAVILAATGLSACATSQAGNPVVEIAPGYVACITETSLGLTGGRKSAGITLNVKWGCKK